MPPVPRSDSTMYPPSRAPGDNCDAAVGASSPAASRGDRRPLEKAVAVVVAAQERLDLAAQRLVAGARCRHDASAVSLGEVDRLAEDRLRASELLPPRRVAGALTDVCTARVGHGLEPALTAQETSIPRVLAYPTDLPESPAFLRREHRASPVRPAACPRFVARSARYGPFGPRIAYPSEGEHPVRRGKGNNGGRMQTLRFSRLVMLVLAVIGLAAGAGAQSRPPIGNLKVVVVPARATYALDGAASYGLSVLAVAASRR